MKKKSISESAVAVEKINYKNKQELLEAVILYTEILKNYQRKGIVHYITFGKLLFNLKVLYMRKCEACKNNDSLDYMSCKRCCKISDSKTFFNDVKTVYQFANGHINSIINIYMLSDKFNNFKYIPFNISTILPHISCLTQQMTIDIDFWK